MASSIITEERLDLQVARQLHMKNRHKDAHGQHMGSTWEAHGQPGWSLGLDMQHYRCQKVYITATASE
jgi:hypothetical protein